MPDGVGGCREIAPTDPSTSAPASGSGGDVFDTWSTSGDDYDPALPIQLAFCPPNLPLERGGSLFHRIMTRLSPRFAADVEAKYYLSSSWF